MGIAASQSCLYLDLVVMERFILKHVRLKLKCDLHFQGCDGKSSHTSFRRVLCSYIKSDLKSGLCKELCSLCRLVFYNWLCALLNAENTSLKLFTQLEQQPCLRSKLANCFSIALIQNAFNDRISHICFSEPTQPLTKFSVQVCTHFPEWFMNHCAFFVQ